MTYVVFNDSQRSIIRGTEQHAKQDVARNDDPGGQNRPFLSTMLDVEESQEQRSDQNEQ